MATAAEARGAEARSRLYRTRSRYNLGDVLLSDQFTTSVFGRYLMLARFNRPGLLPCTLGLAIVAGVTIGSLSPAVHAQQPRMANDGVYTDAPATGGRKLI